MRVYRLYSYAVAGYLEDSLLQPGLVIVYIIFSIKKTQLTCVDELKINITVETGLVSCQSDIRLVEVGSVEPCPGPVTHYLHNQTTDKKY